MGYFDNNVYYSPEQFGLVQVAMVEEEPNYDFHMFVVWKEEKGGKNARYYWASDSGCSCPAPFEDYHSLEDLESGTALQSISALKNWTEDSYTHVPETEVVKAIEDIQLSRTVAVKIVKNEFS